LARFKVSLNGTSTKNAKRQPIDKWDKKVLRNMFVKYIDINFVNHFALIKDVCFLKVWFAMQNLSSRLRPPLYSS